MGGNIRENGGGEGEILEKIHSLIFPPTPPSYMRVYMRVGGNIRENRGGNIRENVFSLILLHTPTLIYTLI
jgi:hypothetical protein